jgi:CRP-like cAMP-binding protein
MDSVRHPVLHIFDKQQKLTQSPELESILAGHFKKETLKKKTTLFMNGDSFTRHYFVEKGLLRLFIIDTTGKEFNLLFACENQVLGDLSSPAPTSFNLETIEDSVVYSVDDHGIRALNEYLLRNNYNEANTHIRRSYLFLQKRLVAILSRTAEDNYLEFRQKNPILYQRLPQYHLASYLGVSPEFLSKIIARTTKK